MYFENFPDIFYDFNIAGENVIKVMKDITFNVRVFKELTSNISLYELYDIRDGDTPEIISEKFYGTPLYHWALMIFNERYSYITDFPLSQYQLETYVAQKYENPYATHHYVDENGFIVDSTVVGAAAVTNYEFEETANEKKRPLKIISPEVMSLLVQQFNDIVSAD